MLARRGRLDDLQRAALNGQRGVRRNDVDVVGGDLVAVLCLRDRHGGMRRQQVDQHAGVVRIEVLDQNERHARIGRHMS